MVDGHVFADESKRRDFVLVAGAHLGESVVSARRSIRKLYLPGQHSIHMVKEDAGRQRTILRTIADLQVDLTIYVAAKGSFKTEKAARQRCLEELVSDIARNQGSYLCLDRDESSEADDRRIIRQKLERVGYKDRLRYTHAKARGEPLLVIPDAIAWAWPQKGWRAICESLVQRVQEV